MRKITIVALVVVLSGCASSAMPNLYNGEYYMAGDDDCKQMHYASPQSILCKDSKGRETGYRGAMTYEQVQMFYQNQMYQQAQMQQLNQQLQQMGNSWRSFGETSLQQAQQYSPPAVMPMQSGGNRISCVNVGAVTNCRY